MLTRGRCQKVRRSPCGCASVQSDRTRQSEQKIFITPHCLGEQVYGVCRELQYEANTEHHNIQWSWRTQVNLEFEPSCKKHQFLEKAVFHTPKLIQKKIVLLRRQKIFKILYFDHISVWGLHER